MQCDINRHRMKAAYQKNMFYAQLAVICLFAVPIGLWVIFSSEQTQTLRVRVHNVHVDAMTPPGTKPTKRNIGGAPDNTAAFHGQFGIKVKIVPDNPTSEFVLKPTPVVHTQEELATVIDSDISVSDLTEGESGPYVPGDAEYTFDFPPETTVVELEVVPCSVLVAVKPEYPYVARSAGKEGVAGIIVCIDKAGKVTLFPDDVIAQFREKNIPVEKMSVKVDGKKRPFNYVVTLEQPSGYFFAKKIAEVLPKWVFAPSRVGGQPVKSLIPIGNAFCLTDDCHYEYEVLRNYKQYTK